MHELSIEGFRFFCDNREEAFTVRHEVFSAHTYYFETDNQAPTILDIGANTGLATLYFKKIYPHAKITAVEPHPRSYELLSKNCYENMLEGVTTLRAAVVDDTTKHPTLLLHTDTAGKWLSTTSVVPRAWNGEQQTTELRVPTCTLDSLITGPVDCLKMDIEGAEQKVLMAARTGLSQVRELIVEFHPHAGQNLAQLSEFLHGVGFELLYTQDGKEQDLNKINPRRLIILSGRM